MCPAIPMQVMTVERTGAICEARGGSSRAVSPFLLGEDAVQPGDRAAAERGFALAVPEAAHAADA